MRSSVQVSVILPHLPPETIALVEATAGRVEQRRAAIIFRAWHRLETESARRLLFAQFTFDGHVLGLLEAIVATMRQESWPGMAPFSPIPLRQQERTSLAAMLEGALIGALGEVLEASALVVDAWREAFRLFMGRLAPA